MPTISKGNGDKKSVTKEPTKAPKKSKEKSPVTRSIVYPEIEVFKCVGEDAITVSKAKEILGWKEETEEVKFGSDYLLTDRNGKKIRCENNVTNRPLYMSVVETLVNTILNRRWRYNGEPIILGVSGLVLNGQHTLIALILAAQDWAGSDRHHWIKFWASEPTIDKNISVGVDEGDETVNSMDTCKPRSLSDVIYRSTYFAKYDSSKRRAVSRICDYAIRLLWHRTGVSQDAFAPKRTHAESIDFLARHPKILDAVRHIFEEDNNKDSPRSISRWVAPGYAAGMLYLMGSAKSDVDTYKHADPPSEKQLDWGMWDKARSFWVDISRAKTDLQAVKSAIGLLVNTEAGASLSECLAILSKAWMIYSDGGEVMDDDVKLEYKTNQDGVKKLIGCPTVGGIDLGNPGAKDEDEEEEDDPTEEEVQERKAEIDQANLNKKRGK